MLFTLTPIFSECDIFYCLYMWYAKEEKIRLCRQKAQWTVFYIYLCISVCKQYRKTKFYVLCFKDKTSCIQWKHEQNVKEGWQGAPKTQLITWEVIFSTVIFCGLFIWLNRAAESRLLVQVERVLAVASMNDN